MGNPGNVLLTSRNCQKYFYQCTCWKSITLFAKALLRINEVSFGDIARILLIKPVTDSIASHFLKKGSGYVTFLTANAGVVLLECFCS